MGAVRRSFIFSLLCRLPTASTSTGNLQGSLPSVCHREILSQQLSDKSSGKRPNQENPVQHKGTKT